MEMELLQTIADNTEAKDSFYVIITTKNTNTVTSFSPPIIFRQRSNGGTDYEMALVGLNTYYSFPNIDKTNNCIKISHGHVMDQIILPVGCYEVTAINKEIKRQLKWGKDVPVTLTPNNNTLNCIMTIKKDYVVEFDIENSLASVLGFEKKKYTAGRYESEETVNILKVNSVLVYCDIITGSRVDGVEAPIIYHFLQTWHQESKLLLNLNSLYTYLLLLIPFHR